MKRRAPCLELSGSVYSQEQEGHQAGSDNDRPADVLLPRTHQCRQRFHSKLGIVVWLATSAREEELQLYLQALDAEGKIGGCTVSEDIEDGKPEPSIFESALKGIDRSHDEVLTVGDTVWDIHAARASGLSAAAVLTGGAFSQGELKEAGAVRVYRDCREMLLSGFSQRMSPEA